MPQLKSDLKVVVPTYFNCPISLALMRDPVSLSTGVTYDRASIEKWLDDGHCTCPATMQFLQNRDLIPNHTLRRLIQEWCVENRSKGVERIPTPIPPAQPEQIRQILEDIASDNGRLPALKSLRSLAKSSDRNRRCIETEGAVLVLVDLFGAGKPNSDREVFEAYIEAALGTLVLLSLDETAKRILLGTNQLDTICWLLNRASMDARVNGALLLETLVVDRTTTTQIGSANGAVEGLIGLLEEETYPTAVKAGLKTLLALCSSLKNRVKIVEMGAIPILVELLPSAERGMTERIMALVVTLASCAEGRAAIREHALAIPALVKNIAPASDIVSEHAVGALWFLCVQSSREETIQEALQLGAFNRLLLLIQVECTQHAKQKAKELLKIFSEFTEDTICTSKEI